MKYNTELIKNIEFVFNEEYGKKIITIPYDLIGDIKLETVFPYFYEELYDLYNGYCIYDHSDIKEYIIKYTGLIFIRKKMFDYELDIETVKYLTKKLSKLSHIVFNYNDNTRTIYKNTVIAPDDINEYGLPDGYDDGKLIQFSFAYDCGTYKRVDTPNK